MRGEVSISEARGPWGWTMIVPRAGISLKAVCMWGVAVEVPLIMEVTMMLLRVEDKVVLLFKRVQRISTWASFYTALNFITWALPLHWEQMIRRKMR